jgi:hypothetical protein
LGERTSSSSFRAWRYYGPDHSRAGEIDDVYGPMCGQAVVAVDKDADELLSND